jgi:hypothetical protein
MNLHFPQLGVALVVRKEPPKNGVLVTVANDQSVYLVPVRKHPQGAEVAQGVLGGWNYPDGVAVHLVYGKTKTDMFRYRFAENGTWLVEPQAIEDGFVGLIKTYTGVPLSAGVTPVVIK